MKATKALTFAYQVTRSKRKTVAIHIRHNQVEVRAPFRVPNDFINNFVSQKEDWVLKQLAKQQQKAAEVFAIENHAKIPFLGKAKILNFQAAAQNKVFLDNDHLVIQGKNLSQAGNNNAAKELFNNWLKKQAKNHMVPSTEALANKLNLSDRLKAVRFRKTKSKWGHCSTQGIIQFNWLIMMAPESVVNYLIAHEVCHLVHMNHSAEYHALLASVCDDYQESRLWLKQNEHRFLF